MLQELKRVDYAMLKKYFFLLFIIPSLSFPSEGYSACVNQPQETVTSYYTELSSGNFEKALSYISEKDKILIDVSNENSEDHKEIITTLYKFSSWKIRSVKKQNDDMTITVDLKTPNVGEIMGVNVANHLSDVNSSFSTTDEVWKNTLNILKKGEFDYINITQDLDLVCEDDSWKISFNIAKEKNVIEIIKSAVKLHSEKKYEKAVLKLKEALNLDKDNTLALNLLEKWKRE